MKIIKVMLLLLSITLVQCSLESDPLFIAKKKLKIDLDTYSEKAIQVSKVINITEDRISESYEKFIKINNPRSSDLKRVSKRWKSEYLKIAEEINNLRKDFVDVQNSSIIYFKEIDQTLEKLKDDKDYLDLMEDSQKKKNEYYKELEIAASAINLIDRTISDIQNFDDKMRLYYALDNLDQQISRLKEIANKANDIVKTLTKSTKRGLKIIEDNA